MEEIYKETKKCLEQVAVVIKQDVVSLMKRRIDPVEEEKVPQRSSGPVLMPFVQSLPAA